VVYLIFNEGYAASEGSLVRTELCDEAIWMTRIVARLLPGEPEVMGLLALMLLQHSRRDVRTDPAGELVLLEEQDRTRWDAVMIAEGTQLVRDCMREGRPGPYQIQAAIAALHAEAARPQDTDWPQIAGLYGALAGAAPSPVVELNHAVAVAMADGPGVGLPMVDALGDELGDYYLFHAARADLLRRLGRTPEAVEAYRRALALATNPAERTFLARRIEESGAKPESA